MRTVLLVVGIVTAGACSLPIFQRDVPPMVTETLTGQDLTMSGAEDTYAALELLRPRWLSETGVTLAGDTVAPVVFLDQTPQGEAGFLRVVPVTDVDSVRFLEPPRAMARYGRSYAAGIIQVLVAPG